MRSKLTYRIPDPASQSTLSSIKEILMFLTVCQFSDSTPLAELLAETKVFTLIPYPCDSSPPLSVFQNATGIVSHPSSSAKSAAAKNGVSATDLQSLKSTYGANECHIPIPKFTELFAEHTVAPFFVFQMFCVALWMLDEYWYYSLFTAFMLVVFECTVVFQVSFKSCDVDSKLTK